MGSFYNVFQKIRTPDLPILKLGGGSNLLFTKDFDGLVVQLKNAQIVKIRGNKDFVWLKVDAGVVWHDFVIFCVEKNYGGIENLSLIPGHVGATPVQNIGAYGVEAREVIDGVTAIDLETGEVEKFSNADCQFAYRDSFFKREKKFLVTDVTFKLKLEPELRLEYGDIRRFLLDRKIEEPSIRDVSDAVVAIRRNKLVDPSVIGNAGSFFKNPIVDIATFRSIADKNAEVPSYSAGLDKVKIPAAWLIEKCGWKGKRVGNVGVSPNHALILLRYPGGMGAEICNLQRDIRLSVHDRFCVMLEPEVEIIGG